MRRSTSFEWIATLLLIVAICGIAVTAESAFTKTASPIGADIDTVHVCDRTYCASPGHTILPATGPYTASVTTLEYFPDQFTWAGSLPYLTHGTLSCAMANDTLTRIYIPAAPETNSAGLYTINLTRTEHRYNLSPLPRATNWQTQSSSIIDKRDPEGFTHCHSHGIDMPVQSTSGPFDPASFSNRVFRVRYIRFPVKFIATGPGTSTAALAVDTATVLLDVTTSVIDHSATSTSKQVVPDPFGAATASTRASDVQSTAKATAHNVAAEQTLDSPRKTSTSFESASVASSPSSSSAVKAGAVPTRISGLGQMLIVIAIFVWS